MENTVTCIGHCHRNAVWGYSPKTSQYNKKYLYRIYFGIQIFTELYIKTRDARITGGGDRLYNGVRLPGEFIRGDYCASRLAK